MDTKDTQKSSTQSSDIPSTFYIKILTDGPYVVYGKPPLDKEIIRPDEDGNSWIYQKGKHFEPEGEQYHLCRCGASKKKPFCDGAHIHADWNPKETAPFVNILEHSNWHAVDHISLSDNENYSVYSRFADAPGILLLLVATSHSEQPQEIFLTYSGHCRVGRHIWRVD